MAYLHYVLLGGASMDRPRARFALSSRRWFPVAPGFDNPSASVDTQPQWSARPKNRADAAGAVVGARTGLMVPLHDQAPGRYGIDTRKANGQDMGEQYSDVEEDWL